MPSYTSSLEPCLPLCCVPHGIPTPPAARDLQEQELLSSAISPGTESLTFNGSLGKRAPPPMPSLPWGPRLGAVPLPRDHRAHPTARPPRTQRSRGARSRAATTAATSPARGRGVADLFHLLFLLLLLLLPRPPGERRPALERPQVRRRPNPVAP